MHTEQLKVPFSDKFAIQMFAIQIPTVLYEKIIHTPFCCFINLNQIESVYLHTKTFMSYVSKHLRISVKIGF